MGIDRKMGDFEAHKVIHRDVVVTNPMPNVVLTRRFRRHTTRNVLLEIQKKRFFDLFVGKGKTEVPLYDRIIYSQRDKVIIQKLFSLQR